MRPTLTLLEAAAAAAAAAETATSFRCEIAIVCRRRRPPLAPLCCKGRGTTTRLKKKGEGEMACDCEAAKGEESPSK